MAKHRRRKSGKRRRRVSGSPSVIGRRKSRHHSSKPRRRKHHMSGRIGKRGRKRRRIGAPSSEGIAEFLGLTLGVGVGLFAGEIGGRAVVNMMGGPTPGTITGTAILKVAAGAGTFAFGRSTAKNSSFIKGAGIGLMGSAINDGFRAMQAGGIIAGPPMLTIQIDDNSKKNPLLIDDGAYRQIAGPGVIGDAHEEMIRLTA